MYSVRSKYEKTAVAVLISKWASLQVVLIRVKRYTSQ